MNQITAIEETIQSFYEEGLKKLHFKRVDQLPYGLIKYLNNYFRIEFVYDKGIVETGIGPLDDDWTVSVEGMRALLAIRDLNGQMSQSDRKLIIATRMGHDDQAKFIAKNSLPIGIALSSSNCQQTRKEIQDLYHERWGF